MCALPLGEERVLAFDDLPDAVLLVPFVLALAEFLLLLALPPFGVDGMIHGCKFTGLPSTQWPLLQYIGKSQSA